MQTGSNGWNIPKFHAQFHIPRNIARFGSQLNSHSGPQELNHIDLNKKPAAAAQWQEAVLDRQIATRLAERLVIQQAQFLMSEAPFPQSTHQHKSTYYATKGVIIITKAPGATGGTSRIQWKNKKYASMLFPNDQ